MGALTAANAQSMKVEDVTARAVQSIRALPTVAEIIDGTPLIIASMGFDRVIVSEVRDDVWTPLNIGIPQDAPWAKDILEVGRECPQRLGQGLVEADMMRLGRPILVKDVQDHPRVNRPIAMASKSSSYLAVPVVVGSEIGAFIHVDRYWHQGSPFSEYEGAQLAVVADALGMALERAHLVDKLSTLATELGRFSHGSSVFDVKARDTACRPNPARPRIELTPREQEVADLVASGLTNEQIAKELVLSEATVKSHVKHILRKLGAGHRAEAVSMLLRAGLS